MQPPEVTNGCPSSLQRPISGYGLQDECTHHPARPQQDALPAGKHECLGFWSPDVRSWPCTWLSPACPLLASKPEITAGKQSRVLGSEGALALGSVRLSRTSNLPRFVVPVIPGIAQHGAWWLLTVGENLTVHQRKIGLNGVWWGTTLI